MNTLKLGLSCNNSETPRGVRQVPTEAFEVESAVEAHSPRFILINDG